MGFDVYFSLSLSGKGILQSICNHFVDDQPARYFLVNSKPYYKYYIEYYFGCFL